ncbi:MAG TPA: hypothetical protein VK524_02065 [Polyangiaceae bacterium]|nr:hypothetical protein [Polyangiaceae bacterium]
MQTSQGESAIATGAGSQSAAHEQLQALYVALLMRQERFDEFKQLLALYPKPGASDDAESDQAAAIRRKLNERISAWIGSAFTGLAAHQVLVWRAVLIEEQWGLSLSSTLDRSS